MDDEVPGPTISPSENGETVERSSTLNRAAAVASVLLRNKQLIVAAMEVLRERKVLNEEEQVKIVAAYEQGSTAARSAIHDLLEKLQAAKLGKVVVDLKREIEAGGLTPQKIKDVAQPYLAAAKETLSAEALPYFERAKTRIAELKALEEPTLRRLESISSNFRDASKEIGKGIQGMGREAADELVRRGKRWWMSPETEELEREFFDWVLKNLPKAEQMLVRSLLGVGLLLLLAGVLVAARELQVMEQVAIFLSIFVLIFLGLACLNWGIKFGEAIKAHRGDIEKLARMAPNDRRMYLRQRWAKRAQEEGVITSEEAQTVIMQTIHAAPDEEAPMASEPPRQ